jgi:hypothetical protein
MRAAVTAIACLVACLVACGDSTPPRDAATEPTPDVAPDTGLPWCTGQRYDACNPAAPNCTDGRTCYTIPDLGMSVCTTTCSLNFGCNDSIGECINAYLTMPPSGSICIPQMTNPGCIAPP